ncbi:MAG: pirin family protein [Pseudohongiellaceae bacterium]
METQEIRKVEEILQGRATSDGDGVKLTRLFGGQNLEKFDPFLMLDEFGSEQAQDYIGGFPSHPHRGFETVTYMVQGSMEHRDHMNNVGKLEPGDVQWMNAGSGVIHSEMPRQEQGAMRGFQLWLNLPSTEKMLPATYNDLKADNIPSYFFENYKVHAIAGELQGQDTKLSGAVSGLTTDPAYLDVQFHNAGNFKLEVPDGYTALVYVYEGAAKIASDDSLVVKGQLARLGRKGVLELWAEKNSKILLLTGKPIGESIVAHGPFVMNSVEEIQQAIRDYNEGTLV